ncbi:hypothetical protein [Sphingomonas alpina]|uniref:Uncharacterized protein n=1 Tax=Sphingomonas alpina TaxID=653931 RepID=A0A7H0LHK7_9SPHN|nr:hypothetical protein [Sphingomonas alpina]QNQ09160.1 hypothetical protein H3Z74_21185 [Sphingomonas alpina]
MTIGAYILNMPSVDAQWQLIGQLLASLTTIGAVLLTIKMAANADLVRIARVVGPITRIDIQQIYDRLNDALLIKTDPIKVHGLVVGQDGAALFRQHGISLGALPKEQAQPILEFYERYISTTSETFRDGGAVYSRISLNDGKELLRLSDIALQSLR